MKGIFFKVAVGVVLGLLFVAFTQASPAPIPPPTEAELVIMERMAKISATLQGVCK